MATSGGPAAVPFRLCCAVWIIRTGRADSVPLQCGEFRIDPAGTATGVRSPVDALVRHTDAGPVA
jgi:hypothetical protein